MNNKWDKLKKFVFYRFYDLNNLDSSYHKKGNTDAYEEFKNMMDILENNKIINDKLWVEVSFDEAVQKWADGVDIRCMIINDYFNYEKAKLAYDTLRDESGSPPSALEILSGVWSYRKED